MVVDEHARPLTPASPTRPAKSRRYSLVCFLVTLLFLIVLTIVLMFTVVFKVRDPIMTMNKITLSSNVQPDALFNSASSNLSLTAELSVRNPNVVSLRYSNTTTSIYYRGMTVGQAQGPPGKARAKRTIQMNLTVGISMDQVMSNPDVFSDIGSGLLSVDGYCKVPGRVWLVVTKHVNVLMNCTVSVNLTSMAIHNQTCKSHVDI